MIRIFIFIGLFFTMTAFSMLREINSPYEAIQFLLALILLGVIPIAIGFSPELRKQWQKHKLNQAKQNDLLIEALITSVEGNYTTESGPLSYYILCQWLDKEENKVYLFKSNTFKQNPSPHIVKYQPINIYVQPKNFKKYIIDTSFLPF